MNVNMMMMKLKNIRKGQWFILRYTSDLPLTAEAKRNGYVCYKSTTMTARYGIFYANLGKVKDKVAKGELPTKHELSWGSWKPGYEGTLIEHKNQNYLRVYLSPNKSKVEYFINGQSISKEGLMTLGIIQPSYFKKKSDSQPDCLTIKVENIESIG